MERKVQIVVILEKLKNPLDRVIVRVLKVDYMVIDKPAMVKIKEAMPILKRNMVKIKDPTAIMKVHMVNPEIRKGKGSSLMV